MGDDNPEQRVSDATIEHQRNLDVALSEQSPPLTNDNFKSFEERVIPDVNINLASRDIELTKKALIVALRAASDPDDPSHAKHASEGHPTVYAEACEIMIHELEEGVEIDILSVDRTGEIEGDTRKFERFIYTSRPYERETSVPAPQITAEEVARKNEYLMTSNPSSYEKNVRKQLRIVAKEKGVAHALTAAVYLNLSNEQIVQTFALADFQDEMIDERGGEILFPTLNRPEDVKMLNELRSLLVVQTHEGYRASYKPDSYKKARELLKNNGWIKDPDQSNNSFILAKRKMQARVVFHGMTELAHRSAPRNFKDPARTNYIDRRYRGRASSYILTAYLVPVD